jgi:hypothetical protein
VRVAERNYRKVDLAPKVFHELVNYLSKAGDTVKIKGGNKL